MERDPRPTMDATFTRRELLGVIGIGAFASLHTGCVGGSEPRGGGDGPLHFAPLMDVARLIETGELSSVELTEMMLERIEAVDGRLLSYATVMSDHALSAARTADREIQAGSYRGPLHGIPVAVKDLCYTSGVRTMGGTGVYADFVPDFDATAVAKLQNAGAVLLGKLNLTEGAWIGYHPDFEIPVNPWDERLWAGVSSSGSGVATAAGLCFASLGSDTGGSIRFPSAANGVVGLKPTYGRVSRYGVHPLSETLDHVGPMARSVADAAAVFEAISGGDPNDPTSLSDPVPNMIEELGRGVQRLRIGFDRRYATEGVDAELASSIEVALGVLEGLGAQVVDVGLPPFTGEVAGAWNTICGFEVAASYAETFPSRADEFGPSFRAFLAGGAAVTSAQYAEASRVRDEFSTRFRGVLADVDALASPSGGTPVEIRREDQYGAGAGVFPVFEATTPPSFFTFPANYAGTPSLSLPCGKSSSGLPLTIQLQGDRLTEPMLCRIGHAYERATAWHMSHPEV